MRTLVGLLATLGLLVAFAMPTLAASVTGGGVAGGNPTPTPAGTLPNTAASTLTSAPALALSLLLIASLGALVSVRLARRQS